MTKKKTVVGKEVWAILGIMFVISVAGLSVAYQSEQPAGTPGVFGVDVAVPLTPTTAQAPPPEPLAKPFSRSGVWVNCEDRVACYHAAPTHVTSVSDGLSAVQDSITGCVLMEQHTESGENLMEKYC